jgi:hypothetical protein
MMTIPVHRSYNRNSNPTLVRSRTLKYNIAHSPVWLLAFLGYSKLGYMLHHKEYELWRVTCFIPIYNQQGFKQVLYTFFVHSNGTKKELVPILRLLNRM